MKILVINCGSSSLKYQLIDMENEKLIAKGTYERIGEASFLTHKINGEKYVLQHPVKTHKEALDFSIEQLLNKDILEQEIKKKTREGIRAILLAYNDNYNLERLERLTLIGVLYIKDDVRYFRK